VNVPRDVTQMDAGGSGLDEEDFVSAGMPVTDDFAAGCDVSGEEDQMRGAAIFWVNF